MLKRLGLLSILYILSPVVNAQSVSAVASTIDGAEEKISQMAEKQGKSYRVIGAHYGNYVYMAAKLVPAQ